MLDFLLNAIALGTSLGAIWLTTKPGAHIGCRRLGCTLGIVAGVLNLYLQLTSPTTPWSTLGLSIAALFLNIRGAELPTLYRQLRRPS